MPEELSSFFFQRRCKDVFLIIQKIQKPAVLTSAANKYKHKKGYLGIKPR